MSLTLPIDELGRFQVCIKLSPVDGRLSMNLKPLNGCHAPFPSITSGLSINFKTLEEPGDCGLCVFASFDHVQTPSIPEHQEHSPQSEHSIPSPPSKDSSVQSTPRDIMMADPFNPTIVDPTEHSDYAMAPWLNEWPGHFGSDPSQAAVGFSESDLKSDPIGILPSLASNSLGLFNQSAMCDSADSFDGTVSLADMDFTRSSYDSDWSNLPNQMFQNGIPSAVPTSLFSSPAESSNALPSPKSDVYDGDNHSGEMSARSSPPKTSPTGPGTGKQRRRRFSCIHPDCDRQFTSEYTRKVHMGTHEPKPKKALPCTMGCPEVFSRQHDRLRHEVAQHGKPCEWSCSQCRRFFSSERMLNNHKCHGSVAPSRWIVPEKSIQVPTQPPTPSSAQPLQQQS